MEKRYRLVFKGALIAGHDPAETRLRASQRLGANTQQIERLFSGQAVILKRGLGIDAAARYARELRLLGMRMHVEPDTTAAPTTAATAHCRIVFRGEFVPGFVEAEVMLAASERLHASPQQISVMFSGRKTTLKKGLDAEQAKRYVSRLRSIGMLTAIETDTPAVLATRPVAAAPASGKDLDDGSHVETFVHTPLMHASDMLHTAADAGSVELDFTQTMVDHELIATNAQHALPDMEKTELAGEASLQAYMRGEPLPMDTPGESFPLPPQLPARAGITVAHYASTAGARINAIPTLPARSCTSCGARQTQGRYCVHCGHEFPREPKPRPPAPVSVDDTPSFIQAERADSLALAMSRENALPRERPRRFLYVGAVLVGLVLLVWWLPRH